MERALNWVYTHKLDPEYGLIRSGFTADWGDVGKDHTGKKALLLTPDTTIVFGIYTQSKFIQSIGKLTTILKEQENAAFGPQIELWEKREKNLRQKTREHLFLRDKGYFISHIVPDSDQFYPLEKEMLAVGGNAEAILADLMDKVEIKRFIDILKAKMKEYQLKTVSFTLIPPYPAGFFKYHLMSRPWTYQNGGEWDWIGGRVIKAFFLYGFKKEGETGLVQIAKKNLHQFNLNEWQNRKGISQGADFYTGAAGVIGDAISTGYKENPKN